MNLSKNFTLQEATRSDTAKKYKIDNTPNEKQIENLKNLCEKVLQPIRDKFEKPITVTSGFRSPQLNKKVKGSATSQHLKGEAMDITSSDNKELWDLIYMMIYNGEIQVGQLINEKNLSWIHISMPDEKHKNHIFSIK